MRGELKKVSGVGELKSLYGFGFFFRFFPGVGSGELRLIPRLNEVYYSLKRLSCAPNSLLLATIEALVQRLCKTGCRQNNFKKNEAFLA